MRELIIACTYLPRVEGWKIAVLLFRPTVLYGVSSIVNSAYSSSKGLPLCPLPLFLPPLLLSFCDREFLVSTDEYVAFIFNFILPKPSVTLTGRFKTSSSLLISLLITFEEFFDFPHTALKNLKEEEYSDQNVKNIIIVIKLIIKMMIRV